MAQIPTPPASRSASPAPDAEPKQAPVAESPVDLLQSLDNLLERYLHLLDQHQKLQAELGSKLSSGFFSLAQANYTCPPGRHYGADYYDERMKATKRVSLQPPTNLTAERYTIDAENSPEADTKDGNSKPIFEIKTVAVQHTEDESETDDKAESDASSSQEDQSGREEDNSQTGETLATPEPPQAEQETDAKPKRSKKKFRSSNPIHWYGILVPPYLRSAQKSFTEAIESRLPQLASVIVEMRIVEKEVELVRSELGQR
ncbi:uncharacterized protein BO80DRAFT_396319 [Aspergillus ibericus CBS 121593]|uniref:Vacuolar ATPase assembly protein VMA22 n=1 Tax=Aspergillus ibericus CBS 121593 TaxID=1448316 RepID=A0A395HG29_9EURO|nr:hypothetical protein BO80DRAFT_396319 [Aspergillus ibericus CBS 121593]RAL06433.1 hypothetical protein BO80DRAFT_396319 [Aspergillus ibericus CBS 121593]